MIRNSFLLIALVMFILVLGCPQTNKNETSTTPKDNNLNAYTPPSVDKEKIKEIELNRLFPDPENLRFNEPLVKREAQYPFVTPCPDPIAKVDNTSINAQLVLNDFLPVYQRILDRDGGEADPLRLMQILNVNLLSQLKDAFYIEIAAKYKKINKYSERSDALGLGAVEYQRLLDLKYGEGKGLAHRETEIIHDLNKSKVEIYDPFLLCYRALDGDADRTAEARAAGQDKLPDKAITELRKVTYPDLNGIMITVYLTGKPRFQAAIEHAKELMKKYPNDYRGGYFLSCFYRFWQENPEKDKPNLPPDEIVKIRKTAMDAALAANPNHPFLQIEMADVLLKLGKKFEAEEYINKAFNNPDCGMSVLDQIKIFYTKKIDNPNKVAEVDKAMQELQKRIDELLAKQKRE